jgi:transcriptional regulator with XRE-family HTH domain
MERERRRLSREDLATHTGVNPKTIARIERGEVTSSPNTAVLEDYLGIHHATTQAELLTLQNIPDLDLIAELARRLAARRDAHSPEPLGPAGYFRWPASAAPYPESGNTDTTSNDGVADSNGPA